jgi:ankyrin repeat protein
MIKIKKTFVHSIIYVALIGNTALVYAESGSALNEMVESMKCPIPSNTIEKNNETHQSGYSKELDEKLYRYLHTKQFTYEGARKFIEEGANINAIDPDGGGYSLLMTVVSKTGVSRDYETFALYLLEKGANPNIIKPQKKYRDSWIESKTALISAITWSGCERNSNLIKALIEHGADTNFRNSEGRTALSFATPTDCSPEIIELVAKKSDIQIRNEQLAITVGNHHLEWTKVLLQSGADANYKTVINGKEKSMIQLTKSNNELKALLTNYGAY